jgi:hypothetical protein
MDSTALKTIAAIDRSTFFIRILLTKKWIDSIGKKAVRRKRSLVDRLKQPKD